MRRPPLLSRFGSQSDCNDASKHVCASIVSTLMHFVFAIVDWIYLICHVVIVQLVIDLSVFNASYGSDCVRRKPKIYVFDLSVAIFAA